MDKLDGLFDEAMARYRERLVAAVADMRHATTPAAFTAAERSVLGLTRELAGELTRRVVQEVSDDKTRRRAALADVRERASKRGIDVSTNNDRDTEFRTLSGQVVTVRTAYAVAKPRGPGKLERRGSQGTGVLYVLDMLGIAGRSTPALRLLVSQAVCEANSVTSARELLARGGVEIDHKAALRLTYMTTDAALRARQRAVASTTTGDASGAFAGRRVVAAVDGGRVQIRRRVAGRPRRGGRKHFKTEWREPKVLTLYVLDEEGKRDKHVPSVIDGTFGDADDVFKLMRYHLLRHGGHLASELVLIGDGAEWIWNRANALRVGLDLEEDQFHEITDYFHVVERLNEVSKARSRWSDDERLAWFHEQKRRLKEGDVEGIEAAMKRLLRGRPEKRATELAFWARNRDRLRYASFRAAQRPIGSGAVESAVRRVINLRLKSASVCWTEEHAEGVLHLRAHAKSGRWEELEQTVLDNARWIPTSRVTRAAS